MGLNCDKKQARLGEKRELKGQWAVYAPLFIRFVRPFGEDQQRSSRRRASAKAR
jgi:hypothetical protein